MTKENENVVQTSQQEALHELLTQVWEMMPRNLDERETMRDNLKELYLEFMEGTGGTLTTEKQSFICLYQRFDRFLKLCKFITPEEYKNFLNQLKS
ncbi:MAG: hypothetical protein M9916_00940 [Crocinitomicaceae bacterium]|nr:hypothetical protein [Crocinitomicaceae bacterium]